jgi:CyaY protein
VEAAAAGLEAAAPGSAKGPFCPHPAAATKMADPASRAACRHAHRGGRLDTLDFNFIAGILSTMTSATAPAAPSATPAATPPATPLSDAEFHRLSHAVLAQVEVTVDRWLDDDVIDIDSQRTGGLLQLSLPGGSKIILNTQPPLQELWLAAKAGGHHYRHVAGRWLDTRDGTEFFAALSQHASGQAGQALVFSAP